MWYRRHLRPELLRQALRRAIGEDQVEGALAAITPDEILLTDARVDLELVERPGGRLGPNPEATLDDILRSSLRQAVGDVEQLLGPDRQRWAWGRLHVARLAHPLSPLLDEATRARLAVGPVARGGSGDTVGNTAYTPTFTQSGGATFRIVVDVGNWDGSLAMNSPGQAGDPASPTTPTCSRRGAAARRSRCCTPAARWRRPPSTASACTHPARSPNAPSDAAPTPASARRLAPDRRSSPVVTHWSGPGPAPPC